MKTDKLEILFTKLEAGTASKAEMDELESLLAEDYEAREHFLDHAQIDGLLFAAGQAERDANGEKVVPLFAGDRPNPSEEFRDPISGRQRGYPAWIGAAAAVTVLVISLAFSNRPWQDGIDLAAVTPPSADELYELSVQSGTGGASQAHPETAEQGAHKLTKDDEIFFNRDVRPILSDNCFFCHGPDKETREGGLRLDTEEGALDAIVRGDPDASELIYRVLHGDDYELMPPPKSSRTLSEAEKQTLVKWVSQGAKWQEHWAFEPPLIVAVEDDEEGNAIDHFVGKRLKEQGFQFSPQASKETQIRRVTIDLTGLPPTIEEVDAFLEDDSLDAYEKVVDRLLKSPRYAERMTWQWLEAARYADTDGYQNDGPRDMWRWRDWVLSAYQQNMPFDQFTIEQLAGDLLPNATLEQQIATGFNRNHRYNSESGLVLEEFLLENAVDRVDTTSTVWMGVTMACARCHDHKYDPFSQKEYYQMISFFDAVPESGRAVKIGNSEPWIKAPTADQQSKLVALDDKVNSAKAKLKTYNAVIAEQMAAAGSLMPESFPPVPSIGLDHRFGHEAPIVADGSKPVTVSKKPIEGLIGNGRFSMSFEMTPGLVDRGVVLSNEINGTTRKGIFVDFRNGHLRLALVQRWIAGVTMHQTLQKFAPGKSYHIALTNDGTMRASGVKIYVDGQPAATKVIHNTHSNTSSRNHGSAMLVGGSKHHPSWTGEVRDLRFYTTRTLESTEVAMLFKPTLRQLMLESGKFGPKVTTAWKNVHQAKIQHQKFNDSIQSTMVMIEGEKTTPTILRVRGEYHNHGDSVDSGVPEVFPGMPDSYPKNRLGFARWLVSGEHPLTARVAVNRYWQMLFGTGLVKTAEDFGTQGALPSHPELLDWLATHFIENDWDVAATLKTIVMSKTYRQSSRLTPELRQKDPENRWLARAPRLKLPGNVLRDQALHSSGLLVEKMGGASVKPYQPANLWREASNFTYKQDKGDALYRRSLYTYWKRTLSPPSMAVLDTADREWCSVKPKRTNTPLQALTLMNETAFFESARKLGERILTEGGDTIEGRVEFAFRAVLSRSPNEREAEILANGWYNYLAECEKDPVLTKSMQRVGESKTNAETDPVQLGAATALANVILNLEEATVRE
ncbi:MAG: DUF1553 domain-containing protein [Verrucomicrobiota bacterium]